MLYSDAPSGKLFKHSPQGGRDTVAPCTPAIALSGFGMEEDVSRCLEAGFNGHLTKPVNFQKLEGLIWQVVGHNG